MLAQYNDFSICLNLTLNLSAKCIESVLYKGSTRSHAVTQGYGTCMYASAFFLSGLNFNMLKTLNIIQNKYHEMIKIIILGSCL